MSDLTWQEKRNLEKILQMGSGYVLDFTNRSFQEFVTDCTGRNIFDDKYNYDSGSKANRLRAFWKTETNELVAKLLRGLLDYRLTMDSLVNEPALNKICYAIVDRLNTKSTSVDTQAKAPATNSSPSTEQSYDFFIAHAGGDLKPAEDLYDLLAPNAQVFLDTRSLLLGDNWNSVLPLAQKRSLVTVVLISSHSDAAYYESEEIAAAIALARKKPDTHRVVPVFLDDADDVPYGLRVKHALSLKKAGGMPSVAVRLSELLTALKKSASTNSPEVIKSRDDIKTTSQSSFVLCYRCGTKPNTANYCLGKFMEHDFKKFVGSVSTVYCVRCGKRVGENGYCLGSFTEHLFHQFSAGANEIICKRCGKHPGQVTYCVGKYFEHDFQVL